MKLSAISCLFLISDNKYIPMYVFAQPLSHKQDMTQGQFLSGIKMVQVQLSFS